MVIELLVFIVLVVLLSTMVKVKEHFVDGDDGMGFLADLLRPDQMVIELLYDKFEVFNYERSNGKPDMYDSQLSDIYYGRLKDRIAVIADKRIEHIGSSPPFLMVPAFKRSYFGDITERVVLIIDKNKVNKKNLVQFLAELTGNKALTGTIEGDLSITGNLSVAQSINASSITMGGSELSTRLNDISNKMNSYVSKTGDSINGDLSVTGSVKSKVGTLGPIICLHWGSMEIAPGEVKSLSKEPGNPGEYGGAMFQGGFLTTDGSGENSSWTKARLIIRGVGNSEDVGEGELAVCDFYYGRSPVWNPRANFKISTVAKSRGYFTYISPWFTLTTGDVPSVGLQNVSMPGGAKFLCGPTYIQFGN